jgi:hypothetical protein
VEALIMARRKSSTTQAPEAVYECVESFAADIDGMPVVVRLGERVPGDYPARELHPHFFAPAGAPTVDRSRHPGADRAVEETEPPPKPKPPRMLRAKRTVSVDGAWAPDGSSFPGRTIVEAGQEVPENHPIVRNKQVRVPEGL